MSKELEKVNHENFEKSFFNEFVDPQTLYKGYKECCLVAGKEPVGSSVFLIQLCQHFGAFK